MAPFSFVNYRHALGLDLFMLVKRKRPDIKMISLEINAAGLKRLHDVVVVQPNLTRQSAADL
jgi:hypothetical protein